MPAEHRKQEGGAQAHSPQLAVIYLLKTRRRLSVRAHKSLVRIGRRVACKGHCGTTMHVSSHRFTMQFRRLQDWKTMANSDLSEGATCMALIVLVALPPSVITKAGTPPSQSQHLNDGSHGEVQASCQWPRVDTASCIPQRS